MSDDLLGLETRELLKKFGASDHKPGSGSAAGLIGLVSVKLCQTVISLTRTRPGYAEGGSIIASRDSELITIEESLERYVREDSRLFDEVIRLRRKRDIAQGPERRRVMDQLAKATWASTDLPLEMIDELLRLGEIAIQVFQLGFQSARGDSAVAVRAAHAAASGSISIVHLNLQSTRGAARTREAMERAGEQQGRLEEQAALFTRLSEELRDETQAKADEKSRPKQSLDDATESQPSDGLNAEAEIPELLTFE